MVFSRAAGISTRTGDSMNFIIRPAKAEDKQRVAELVYLAGSSHLKTSLFDLMFGSTRPETLKYLERLFTAKNPSWFHFSKCLVAEVEGRVAATSCGYSETENGVAKLRDALVETTGWKGQAFASFAERMIPVMKVKHTPPDDVWVVENVGVFPEYRGQGLVQSLFQQIFDIGRKKGFKRAQITFVIGNIEAEKAYQKAGFKFKDEYTDKSFEDIFASPGVRTFERDL